MDTRHLLRSLWHKSEINHINAVEIKAFKTGVQAFCSDKH